MKATVLFLVLSSIANVSFATGGGSEAGNGGVGVRCANSVELFDLYEGRALNGLVPVEKSEPFQIQAKSFANHLAAMTIGAGDERFDDKIDLVLERLKFLDSGIGLTLTEDANHFIYPKNCDLVQILNDRNDGFIYVDSDLWGQLSETQKAAAVLHETIYRYFRSYDYLAGQIGDGDTNSTRTRRAVAHLIAGHKLQPVRDMQLHDQAQVVWSCENSKKTGEVNSSTSFMAYELPGQTTVEFHLLVGRRMITNASFSVPWRFEEMFSAEKVVSVVDWDITVFLQSFGTSVQRNIEIETDDRFKIQTEIGNQRIQQSLFCRKIKGK